MTFVVHPRQLIAVGALVDPWARNLMVLGGEVVPSVQLRWSFDPLLGFPHTPFTVWRRSTPRRSWSKTWFHRWQTPGGLVLWFPDGPFAEVRARFVAPAPGLALTMNGLPLGGTVTSYRPVRGGPQRLRLAGPDTRCVVLPAGTEVAWVEAITGDQAANDDGWREHEVVGLPSTGETGGSYALDAPQGLVDAGLVDPFTAALDRFSRAAPLSGWADTTPGGQPVEPWRAADPVALVKVFNAEMITDLADMMTSHPSSAQRAVTYQREVVAAGGRSSVLSWNPMTAWLYGGASDSANALCTGLGTGYRWPDVDMVWPEDQEQEFPEDSTVPDFMVSATYLTDGGDKVERACPVLSPVPVPRPFPPAALTATTTGSTSPDEPDGPYRPVVSIGFDAPPDLLGLGISSHALVRGASAPSSPPQVLLEHRVGDSAYLPVGATRHPSRPGRLTLGDNGWAQQSATVPNQLRYGVATVDVFGQWSAWATCGLETTEPAAQRVTLSGPALDAPATSGGPVTATVSVDLSWDWSSRTPATIVVVARRFAQTWATDPPADLTPPGGDGLAATGAGVLATIGFTTSGEAVATPGSGLGAVVQHLSTDGLSFSAVPVQSRGTRRYRLRVEGLGLDFDAHGTWGLAMWARGTERRAPGRQGPWSSQPVVASAADPRPPVPVSTSEDVVLASLADAAGRHHARLSWTAMAGATAYVVHTCSETTFRTLHHLPEPRPSETLRDRLTVLRDAFHVDPDRRPFTRVGSAPVPASAHPSVEVELPRGSRDIHLYVVTGLSAGGVESVWPGVADPQRRQRPVAFAAPQVVAPNAPRLEVSADHDPATDQYRARLRISTAAGPRVGLVEVFRTRVPEASIEVDTMGPPVRSVVGSSGGLVVTPTPPGDPLDPTAAGQEQPIGRVEGLDDVGASWRPVHYRAVAWGVHDPERGQHGVRSAPSVARAVVVPPAGPPPLSALSAVLPTAGSAAVRVDATTTAPWADTVLGPHTVDAAVVRVLDGSATVVELTGRGPLSAVPTGAPPAGVSGLWVDPPATPSGVTGLHLLLRRSAAEAAAAFAVRLRLTDPLGRMSEVLLDVPSAEGGPPPDLYDVEVGPGAGGTVLSFGTNVPDASPLGSFLLEVVLHPVAGVGPVVLPLRLTSSLADLRSGAWARGRAVLVARRVRVGARRRGDSRVQVLARRAGSLTVAVVAPGGARAEVTRWVGSLAGGGDGR